MWVAYKTCPSTKFKVYEAIQKEKSCEAFQSSRTKIWSCITTLVSHIAQTAAHNYTQIVCKTTKKSHWFHRVGKFGPPQPAGERKLWIFNDRYNSLKMYMPPKTRDKRLALERLFRAIFGLRSELFSLMNFLFIAFSGKTSQSALGRNLSPKECAKYSNMEWNLFRDGVVCKSET